MYTVAKADGNRMSSH
jgi:hypothetical protein